ncbi:MAG: cell division protein ZapA [Myxococcota bacterium]|nr:cell division protein ZapA [Myxococcota bacterium]
MSKKSVAVRILGQEYRIRSDADEEWLQHVAACVDAAMDQVRERTKTVDTLDVALLTCLNLAREVLELREREAPAVDPTEEAEHKERLRALIDMAESAGSRQGDGGKRVRENDTPLLTLPTGAEVDETQGSLLDPLDAPLAPSES